MTGTTLTRLLPVAGLTAQFCSVHWNFAGPVGLGGDCVARIPVCTEGSRGGYPHDDDDEHQRGRDPLVWSVDALHTFPHGRLYWTCGFPNERRFVNPTCCFPVRVIEFRLCRGFRRTPRGGPLQRS